MRRQSVLRSLVGLGILASWQIGNQKTYLRHDNVTPCYLAMRSALRIYAEQVRVRNTPSTHAALQIMSYVLLPHDAKTETE